MSSRLNGTLVMRFHIFLHAQYKSPYQEFCESINLYDSKSVNQ